MPTRITQIKNDDRAACVFRVEGSLTLEDAQLLEKICGDLRQQCDDSIVIDLADLTFLDSDSAEVLCRIKRKQDVHLEGLHLFIQQAIEIAEKLGGEESRGGGRA